MEEVGPTATGLLRRRGKERREEGWGFSTSIFYLLDSYARPYPVFQPSLSSGNSIGRVYQSNSAKSSKSPPEDGDRERLNGCVANG